LKGIRYGTTVGFGSVCIGKRDKMVLGQFKRAKRARKRSRSRSPSKSRKQEEKDPFRAYRKKLKECGMSPDVIAIYIEHRRLCGTLEKPVRHENLQRIMEDVRAARYGPGATGQLVKKHVTAAFNSEIFMGFFKAFEVDERGGLTSKALEHQRLQALHVLTEIFVWHMAANSIKGVSLKRTICLSSLWQAMVHGTTTARRLWSSTEGLFLGGDPSPVAALVAVLPVEDVAEKVVLPAPVDATQQYQQGNVNPVPAHWRGRGRGLGGGGRVTCNYCWTQLGTRENHNAGQCPHFAEKRRLAKEQAAAGAPAWIRQESKAESK